MLLLRCGSPLVGPEPVCPTSAPTRPCCARPQYLINVGWTSVWVKVASQWVTGECRGREARCCYCTPPTCKLDGCADGPGSAATQPQPLCHHLATCLLSHSRTLPPCSLAQSGSTAGRWWRLCSSQTGTSAEGMRPHKPTICCCACAVTCPACTIRFCMPRHAAPLLCVLRGTGT